MIHAIPTDDFLAAVQDFDHHARLGRRQVWARPWNPLPRRAQATRVSQHSLTRMGLYPELGAPESAMAVCHDLYEFAHDLAEADDAQGACFIALFKGQPIGRERHFEHLLWRQLQTMHGVDAQYFDQDEAPCVDASRVRFAFGGRAYTVVGRHQGDGAMPRPALVFQPDWSDRR